MNIAKPDNSADLISLRNRIIALESIIDQTNSYIFVKDTQGLYTYVNDNVKKLFAAEDKDIIGKEDKHFFDLSSTDTLITQDNQLLELIESIEQEQTYTLKRTKQQKTFKSIKKPILNADQHIIGTYTILTDITESKQIENRLKESELRWKFALESGGDGVWDWDLANKKVFLSTRCMTILGFSESDKNDGYRNWQSTIHPDDLERIKSDLHNHLENNSDRFYNEHRIKRPDNQWRWILTRGLVVARDANNTPLRMIGTHTDINELKQPQWEQLAKIVNGSPEGMLLVNEQGLIQIANEPAAKIFAYNITSLIGLNVDELLPQACRHNHGQKRAQFVVENKARPMSARKTLQGLRKDGTEFPLEISLTPFQIDHQTSVLVSIIDITERKRLEHEVNLMAMVHKAIGEAVMVADANNHILAINEAFTRLTGYEEHEVVGKTTDVLKSGIQDPDFYQNLWHALDVTGHWQGEIWNKRKNGEIYKEWLVINSIYNAEGEVERRVAMFSEITQQKQIEQAIWQQANFDPLTNLANRRMFQDRLKQEIKKSYRNNTSLALMLLDLDRFKEINDTLGHGMGDILLQETAKRLISCVRQVDTVSRLGGDEFTVILGELTSEVNADRIAQCILGKLAEPFQLGDELAYISVSIGITFYPQDAKDAEQLVKNADQAMYTAKQQGRNRYSYFTLEMEKSALERMRLTNDLRQALANNEFQVYYQPIYSLSDNSLVKAEALIRWLHPTRGMVSPKDFIPLAEDTGLIIDIGDWLFKEVVAQVTEWKKHYQPDFKIAINQSPVQFTQQGENGNDWINYLHQQGLPCNSIMIEITEGLLLDINNTVRKNLFAYRDAGIEIAIDDFGTGYSSLSYLKKLDIDYLKIDQSFTCHLVESPSNLALSEAIIVMAHKLGLKVIAEGIETQAQLELLKAAGCDLGQGYLFSKPVPAEKFITFFTHTLSF